MNLRHRLITAAGVVVTTVCLAALYRGLDAQALGALRSARLSWLGACLLLGVLALAIRTQRWRALLLENAYIPFRQAFWTNAAGQMMNTFLPARMGDAFRGVAASTSSSRAFSLGTIVVERVLDTAVVVCAAIAALLLVPSFSWWMTPSVLLLGTAVALAIAGLAMLPAIEHWVLAAIRRWHPSSEAFVIELIAGISLVWKPLTVSKFLALSAAAWGLDALGITVAAYACGASLSYGGGVLLVTVLAFASAIPATGIAGLAPIACAFVLPSFGIGRGMGLAIGIVLQTLNLILTAVTGGVGLWLLRYRSPPMSALRLSRETI